MSNAGIILGGIGVAAGGYAAMKSRDLERRISSLESRIKTLETRRYGRYRLEVVDDTLKVDLLDYVTSEGAIGFEDVAAFKVNGKWYVMVSLYHDGHVRKYFGLFRIDDPLKWNSVEWLGVVFSEEPQIGNRISDAFVYDDHLYILYDQDRELYIARTPIDSFPDAITWEQALYIPRISSDDYGLFQEYLIRLYDRIAVIRAARIDVNMKYMLEYIYWPIGTGTYVMDEVKAIGGLNLDDWNSHPKHSERGVIEFEPGKFLTCYEILRSDGIWRIGCCIHTWKEHYPVSLKNEALIIEHGNGVANPNEILRISEDEFAVLYNQIRDDYTSGFPGQYMRVAKMRVVRE